MALSISPDLSTMRCAAGEPIVFSFQDADGYGIPRPVDGRAFVWAIYDQGRNEVGYYNGQNRTDDIGPDVLWTLDGSESASLFGQSLRWELSERLDNGRDRIASGLLTIDESAPRIEDYDAAPIARYIARIKRSNDPATVLKPVYEVTMVAWGASNGSPPSQNTAALDFSDTQNSGLVAVLVGSAAVNTAPIADFGDPQNSILLAVLAS